MKQTPVHMPQQPVYSPAYQNGQQRQPPANQCWSTTDQYVPPPPAASYGQQPPPMPPIYQPVAAGQGSGQQQWQPQQQPLRQIPMSQMVQVCEVPTKSPLLCCCNTFDLATGTIAIGVVEITLFTVGLISLITIMPLYGWELGFGSPSSTQALYWGITAGVLLFCALYVMANAMQVHAVLKNSPGYLWCAMVMHVILAIIAILAVAGAIVQLVMGYRAYFYYFRYDWGEALTSLLSFCASVGYAAVEIYFLHVRVKYYQQARREERAANNAPYQTAAAAYPFYHPPTAPPQPQQAWIRA